jgi:hypothetical protein
MVFDEISFALLAITSGIMVTSLLWLLPTLNKANRSYKESTEILSDMLTAVRSSISQQERKLLDCSVRLDVLEERTRRVLQTEAKPVVTGDVVRDITVQDTKIERIDALEGGVLRATDRTILSMLIDGSKSSREIKTAVNKSREHVAREMKRMFDEGLVSRSASMPYIYSLTNKGRLQLG